MEYLSEIENLDLKFTFIKSCFVLFTFKLYCKVLGSDLQPTFIHLQNVNRITNLQGELHILDSIIIVDC